MMPSKIHEQIDINERLVDARNRLLFRTYTKAECISHLKTILADYKDPEDIESIFQITKDDCFKYGREDLVWAIDRFQEITKIKAKSDGSNHSKLTIISDELHQFTTNNMVSLSDDTKKFLFDQASDIRKIINQNLYAIIHFNKEEGIVFVNVRNFEEVGGCILEYKTSIRDRFEDPSDRICALEEFAKTWSKTPYEKYEDQHRIITTQHVRQP